ncbi:WD40-repeat-containing domain, partial [Trinorchestia longiramus]
ASCHGNRTVMVFSSETGELVRILGGHNRSVWAVAFHPQDPDKVASGCLAGIVRLW